MNKYVTLYPKQISTKVRIRLKLLLSNFLTFYGFESYYLVLPCGLIENFTQVVLINVGNNSVDSFWAFSVCEMHAKSLSQDCETSCNNLKLKVFQGMVVWTISVSLASRTQKADAT